jgi:hypothetical protein
MKRSNITWSKKEKNNLLENSLKLKIKKKKTIRTSFCLRKLLLVKIAKSPDS